MALSSARDLPRFSFYSRVGLRTKVLLPREIDRLEADSLSLWKAVAGTGVGATAVPLTGTSKKSDVPMQGSQSDLYQVSLLFY